MKVLVLGAGVVGLACAVELHRAGHDVHVFDPRPGAGATHAAAGMLSPAGEVWHGEEDVLCLGLESARLWPEYADRLTRDSGVEVDHRRAGTVLAGYDRDDVAVIQRSVELLGTLPDVAGVTVEPLGRRELRRLEPTLSSRVCGGAFLPGDHSVNPRQVARAMLAVLGDRVIVEAAEPEVVDGRCRGAVTETGGRHGADVVVVATGTRLPESVGTDLRRAVRPVRGEIVRARTNDPPEHTVRGRAAGEEVYVVPRAGGEVVIGATVEEHAGDPLPTVGGVWRLLHAARLLLPGLDPAAILDITARDRPGTPDNRPLLGPTETSGLLLAAGHYRGGVLLAPATARILRAHIDGTANDSGDAFSPRRLLKERTAGT